MYDLLIRIISIMSLIIILPIIFIISIAIFIDIGNPIFFSQNRIGYKGNVFKIIKFRTMLPQSKVKNRDDNEIKRLTNFTRLLRKSSLDELPTIINVIKGEMVFVGPRPLLEEYRDEYTTDQFVRHDVKPGITGWAQVNGRNKLNWSDKFKMDIWYVENKSILLDIRIILMTILKVLKSDGIDQSEDNTMERFTRNSK